MVNAEYMYRDESFNSTVYKGSSAYHQVSWEETKEVRTTTSSIWACLKCCPLIRCAPMGCLDFFTLEFYELTDLGAAFHSRPNLMLNRGASVPWEEWAQCFSGSIVERFLSSWGGMGTLRTFCRSYCCVLRSEQGLGRQRRGRGRHSWQKRQ